MIDVVVFSKNRALQLDALLRSFRYHFQHDCVVEVIYSATTLPYVRGYKKLRAEHPDIVWTDDKGKFADVVHRREWKHPYTMFLVDDMVFIRDVSPITLERLEQDPLTVACSIRLGRNISHQPVFIVDRKEAHVWSWPLAHKPWNYPMSVDGNIFRTSELLSLIPFLEFKDPNTFESQMSLCPLPPHRMVCGDLSSTVNLSLNRVQNTFKRNAHGDYSVDDLNQSWLADRRIEVMQFHSNTQCHIIPQKLAFI